ncbi:Hypothetical protein (Fragment) [Durusdinium trenchii]|uniref:Methyltransferase FkbM domain-containing protein n=1 Tax=Durusdinium trenchii TaxID=1381693 RepID=A0ABP0SBD5_9DINO
MIIAMWHYMLGRLLVFFIVAVCEDACDELREVAMRMAPMFELASLPMHTQALMQMNEKAAKTCQVIQSKLGDMPNDEQHCLSGAALLFCRQAFHIATGYVIPHCPLDLFGWSSRGSFDFLREEVLSGRCKNEIQLRGPKAVDSKGSRSRRSRPCVEGVSFCATRVLELRLLDDHLVTSLWIDRPGGVHEGVKIQFHTGDRWKWMRNGALNTSGWHEVRGERIRGLKILAPGRRFCLCVALQGCGWQHRPSPSFSTLLQEPYPVFGMQYLIQDSLMKYMKSKENANTDSETLVVEGDGADAQILSPHLARAGRFLLALEAQLAAPASRLRPLEELLPKPWRLGAELLLLELHAAQALRQAPLDGRVGSAFWEHVQQAEGAFRHTDTTGPGASACGVTGAWQFLHRAQLRLQGRDAPMDDLRDPMVNITAYLSEEREGPCGQVAFPGQNGADRWALEEVFCCKTGGVYVDIGAAHSWRISNTYTMDAFLGWMTGLCVDVFFEDPETFDLLRRCQRLRRAVWRASDERRTFRRPTRTAATATDMAASLGEAWTFTTATVSTISLWDLLRRFANSSEGFTVDFLSMDIEGNSEDVLEAFFEKRDEELTKHGAKPDATSEMDIFIATLAVEISNDEEQQSWNTSRTGRLLTRHGYELDHRRGLDEYWRHSSVQHCKKAERFRPLGDELGREGAEDHCASQTCESHPASDRLKICV